MAAGLVRTKTPGIYKRGDSYVVAWTYRGTQHRKSFRTLALAREAKAQVSGGGDRTPPTSRTFGDYFDEWIVSYSGRTSRGFSESTRKEYRRPIETVVLPEWRAWKLGEIEPKDVRALYAKLRRDGTSTSAIKKVRAPLSALFATAVEDGLVRTNPMVGVRIPAAPETEVTEEKPKALTRAELGLFLTAVDKEWRLFFEFLAHTGVRISESLGLRWEHVDLGEKPRVEIREQFYEGERKKLKTSYSRRDLPLSPGMKEKLLAHRRDHYGGPKSPVFPSSTGSELNAANVYGRYLVPAAVAIGKFEEYEVEVPRKGGGTRTETRKRSLIGFHAFRHTCASLLFDSGRNVKEVSTWLGHADPGFTLRTYVHLLDEGLGSADFLDTVTSTPVELGEPV
jgi:integrase